MIKFLKISGIILLPLLSACSGNQQNKIIPAGHPPRIEPDYTGTVLPLNIAPLNFIIREEGQKFKALFTVEGEKTFTVRSRNNIIRIPARKWKKLLEGSGGKNLSIDITSDPGKGEVKKFETIINFIAPWPIDPYLTYRVIYPGFERWNELSICQRDLTSFRVRTLVKNSAAEVNCINCHSFNNGNTDDFLFHMRGSLGGTYFLTGGIPVKYNLKTPEMKNSAVYPRWHPSGRFVAFSSNKVVQQFHITDNKKIEVSDLESSLLLYDRDKNEIMPVPLEQAKESMDTYPEWSPDGHTLYFCRATQIREGYDYRNIRYDLWKVTFDPEKRTFGKEEPLFVASETGKSIAFPRVSPDGKYLVVTVSNYGCFPIWHPEADLWSIDTKTGIAKPLSLNSSSATESYHSWSSNGKWLVFATRRDNGSVTKPYIAYFNNDGESAKPFALPQKNPAREYFNLKSYNLPELSRTRITLTPGKVRKFSRQKAINTRWAGN